MSRGSSINIAGHSSRNPKNKDMKNGFKVGIVEHNTREKPSLNSIFEVNEETVQVLGGTAKDAQNRFDKLIAPRIEAYQKRKGQQLQKSTILHFSSIINLEAHHTMKDLVKVGEYLEEKLDTKVFQVALHRDEGHTLDPNEMTPHQHANLSKDAKVDEDGKIRIINHHAHFEFLGIDRNGDSIRRKLSPVMLSQIQSDVAQILGMRRGKQNKTKTKEERKATKRLSTYAYKGHKKRENQELKQLRAHIKVLEQQLKEQAKAFRAEMRAMGAMRADYALMEQKVKETKDVIELQKLDMSIASTLYEVEDKFNEFADLRKTIANRIEDRKMEEELEGMGLDPARHNADVKVDAPQEEPTLHYDTFKNAPTPK